MQNPRVLCSRCIAHVREKKMACTKTVILTMVMTTTMWGHFEQRDTHLWVTTAQMSTFVQTALSVKLLLMRCAIMKFAV